MTLVEDLLAVVGLWQQTGPRDLVRARLDAIEAELRGPLRIAVVGRANAGKSTLLNAIVGERLAPTDATDCTRVITEYREHHAYEVVGVTADGRSSPLSFVRTESGIQFDLPSEVEVTRVLVGWPAARLAGVTFVDTPGLDAAARADGPIDRSCDAVVYVLRDAHPLDAGFLDAVLGTRSTSGQATTAIAVLGRADELGAGSGDPFAVARGLAARRHRDARLASLVGDVLPVSGLLAEAAATATSAELGELRAVASFLGRPGVGRSVDMVRLLARDHGAADAADRVLDRFGLVGVQLVAGWLAATPADAELDARDLDDASLLARLSDVSGLGALRALIATRFDDRADVLRGVRALGVLRVLADWAEPPDAVAGAIERVVASSVELLERRLSEAVEATDVAEHPVIGEARQVLSAAATGGSDEIDRWRTRAASPLLGATEREVVDLVVRLLESRMLSH